MTWKTGRRLCPLSAGLASAMLLAACAAPDVAAPVAEPTANVTSRSSALGSYLAGKVARCSSDTPAAADFYAAALEDDPGNQALLARTLSLQLAEGRLDEALVLAERRIAVSPQAPMARIALATTALQDDQPSVARRHLEQSATAGFAAFMQPLLLAWALAGEGDTDAALAALEPLASRQAFDGFRIYHTALLNDIAGRQEAAEAAYQTALDSEARDAARLVLAYGALLDRLGRSGEARALFASYLARQPSNPVIAAAYQELRDGEPVTPPVVTARDGAAETFLGAAGALAREPVSESAKIYVQLALQLRPDLDSAYMLLGEIREAAGRYEDANIAYGAVAKDSPYKWEARIRIAANLDRMERTDDAIRALAAMAAERPEDTAALIASADILRARERYAEAVQTYDQAFERIDELSDRHWSLLYARGIALERSRQWERAETNFLRALELRPDQPLVLNYLGYSWTEQGVHLDKAQRMIEKAVEQRPNDGYIVDSLGWVYFRMGRYEDAVRHLERAVELRPEDPVINEHLGDAYWRVGRYLEARFQWQHALVLGPADDQVSLIEAKLTNGLPASSVKKGNG